MTAYLPALIGLAVLLAGFWIARAVDALTDTLCDLAELMVEADAPEVRAVWPFPTPTDKPPPPRDATGRAGGRPVFRHPEPIWPEDGGMP